MITCHLLSHSNSHHVQQIYTGFSLLKQRGLIELKQSLVAEQIVEPLRTGHLRNVKHAHLNVLLNNRIRLHYDLHDSWEVEHPYLKQADFYFKRSYSHSFLGNLGNDLRKVCPLGLYYEIFPNHIDPFALQRIFMPSSNWKERIVQFFRSIDVLNLTNYYPRIRFMEALPDVTLPPKILFMARLWDPKDEPSRAENKVEERFEINQMRANCVRALRDEFGKNFYGGIIHTEYARRNYRDCLLPDNSASSKRNYIKLLKSHPICVATTGLHGSIGGKFSEYIAYSRAILSEKLNYEVGGDLRAGTNYLEFSSPEECVRQAKRLILDDQLRENIMINNTRYYQSYLRPDVLVLNSILVGLQGTNH